MNKVLNFLFNVIVFIVEILKFWSAMVLFFVLTDLSEHILVILYPKYEWIQLIMYIGMYFVSLLLTIIYYEKLQENL